MGGDIWGVGTNDLCIRRSTKQTTVILISFLASHTTLSRDCPMARRLEDWYIWSGIINFISGYFLCVRDLRETFFNS